jgi:hypothetical protein
MSKRGEFPNPVTLTVKLLELDASNEDGLLRLAFESPDIGVEGRKAAPFLYRNVKVTISIGEP